jgi:hypothetical protein
MNTRLGKKEITLLGTVSAEGEFYPSLTEDEESRLLRSLAEKGFIKWCRYPEEFYIITVLGKDLIREYGNE